MRKFSIFVAFVLILSGNAFAIEPLTDDAITISAPSAILMEKESGEIIYEKNAHEKLSPASVTKVMTMLLIVEEIESGRLTLEEMVTGSARAREMGGSQIWLEEGEQMSVHDMLKAVAVASANDCAVAMAEHIAGTEEAFAARMNERAEQLGMTDTVFSNCTGLFESDNHLTTAHDIALMSRELIGHDIIKEYTTIWMDDLRDGEFGLSNTNKLIYYYKGATGLKTGFTTKAMYCLAATAERDGVEYIAVVMHAPTSNDRFESAKTLLNYAFANYTLLSLRPTEGIPDVPVELGRAENVPLSCDGAQHMLIKQSELMELEYLIDIPEKLEAPVTQGQQIGTLTVKSANEVIAKIPLKAAENVDRSSALELFISYLAAMF